MPHGRLLSEEERYAFRQRMRKTELTQEKIADLLSVRQSAVSLWLTGKNGISYTHLEKLRYELGLGRPFPEPVAIDMGLAMALEREEIPTMQTLDVLKNCGYRWKVDPRVPLREFYRSGKDVRRVYQKLAGSFLASAPLTELEPTETDTVRVVEIPTPRYFWVSYKLATSHRLVVFILKNEFRGTSFLPTP